MANISNLFTVNKGNGTLNNYSVVSSDKNGVYRVDFDIDIIFSGGATDVSIKSSTKTCKLTQGGNLDIKSLKRSGTHVTFYIEFPESSLTDYFNFYGEFWNSSKQFTLSDKKGSTGILVSTMFNSEPTINGRGSQNINLGEKNEPFSITYKVNDTDENDILTVTEYLDGGLLKTRSNAIRNTSYSIDISREQLYSLSESGTHTISVSVSDGNAETTTNWKFIRVNLVPELTIITGIDESTIFKASSPSITYSVNDPENEEVKVGILVDGKIIQPLEVVTQNDNHEISTDHDNGITILNGKHTFTLQAEDAQGGISTKEYSFIKNEDTIEIQLKEPIKTDSAVQGVYLTIIKDNVDNSSVQVLVTNNGLDEAPTWEDATEKVLSMSKYTFTNTSKTADNFALDVKITATRTTETGTIKILGIGGSMV